VRILPSHSACHAVGPLGDRRRVKTCSRKHSEFGIVWPKADLPRRLVAPQLNGGGSPGEGSFTLRQPPLLTTDRRSLITDPPTDGSAVADNRQRITNKRPASGAFTLMELLVVMGIISVLLILLVPAFTSIKSAGDVTNTAYAVKGVLDQARTYAMANNTYTWVGFAGSIGTSSSSVTGQISMAIVASTDGTSLGLSSGQITQLGKLLRLDNVHVGDPGPPANNGTEFENRPAVSANYELASAGATSPTFIAQATTFNRWIQFSPRGEAVVNGAQIAHYAEVGLLPTHGSILAVTKDGNGRYPGNVAAIQITGYGGNVRIYRR
jgi:type II secretory pathway pseudopilin PulG